MCVKNEERIEIYRAQTMEVKESQEENNVERKWEKIKKWVERATMKKTIQIKEWKIIRNGDKKWWDTECRKKEIKVKETLKDWRKG